MVLDNRRITTREIAEAMSMSKKRVYDVIKWYLGMRMLFACCMPRLHTLEQKSVRMNISNSLLVQFRHNKSEFWCRLIIIGKTVDCWLQRKRKLFLGWKSDDDCFLGWSYLVFIINMDFNENFIRCCLLLQHGNIDPRTTSKNCGYSLPRSLFYWRIVIESMKFVCVDDTRYH